MRNSTNKFWRFLSCEDGPTAVEYAVMLGLIIMVCVLSIGQLGTTTSENFEPVRDILAR